MTDKLLPCPFCGSEAHVWRYFEGRYAVHCNECTARLALYGDHPKEETIAAWNTRAERTCRVDSSISYDCMYLAEYEHELTCGHTVTTLDREPPSWCPECGARVVSGDGVE